MTTPTPENPGARTGPVEAPTAAGRPVPPPLPVPAGSENLLTPSMYERFGGRPAFETLVNEFYRGIADDPVLRPMYPEEDLGPATERMLLFLEQYWGGPGTYSERRGHPRLRMRHNAFKVNPEARDRWLLHMRAGVDKMALPPADEAILWDYLSRAAVAMVNTFED